MKKEVTHKNIIKGLLKEALFLDLEVQLKVDSAYAHGRIVELNDSDTDAMMIYLDIGSSVQIPQQESLPTSIFFKNFMATFEAQVSFLRFPFLMINLPAKLQLTNERNENRHHLADGSSQWTRVLVSNESGSTPARFRPTNISSAGMGGELVFPSDYKLNTNTEITGEQWFNGQWLKIQGFIKSVRQLTEQHDQHTFCIIGLQKNSSTVTSHDFVRRPIRLDTDTEIELQFISQPAKKFDIKVVNVSIGGFLARITDKEIKNLAISSQIASRSRSSMKAHLVSFEADLFRFQWIAGNEEDRINWLKQISQYFGPEIDPNSLRKEDILSLFCQSGALSNQYIKEQRSLSKDLLDALSTNSSEEPWIFRWTNRTSDGQAKGYVGAIKSGENCWSIIDIVSDRYEHKLDKDFLPNFFVTLMDFSRSITPCPKHFLGWVKDHPFFSGFENHLHQKNNLILSEAEMLYTRIKKETIPNFKPAFESQQVDARAFSEIKMIRSQLEARGLLEIADAMDFNENSFGSFKLAEQFQSKNLPFKREYWYFKNGHSTYFAVFTLIPEGQNPGRWVDSIFVFELSSTIASEELWKQFKNQIIQIALEKGYSTHAIRRIMQKGSAHRYSDEVVHLSAYLLHPDSWIYFDQFVKKIK